MGRKHSASKTTSTQNAPNPLHTFQKTKFAARTFWGKEGRTISISSGRTVRRCYEHRIRTGKIKGETCKGTSRRRREGATSVVESSSGATFWGAWSHSQRSTREARYYGEGQGVGKRLISKSNFLTVDICRWGGGKRSVRKRPQNPEAHQGQGAGEGRGPPTIKYKNMC